MQSETERLRDSRDRMVEFLGRIHTDLGAVLAETLQAGGETAVMAEEAPLEHAEAEMEAPASANGEAEPLPDPQTHPQ